jgi:hypothetical protein
MRIEGSRMHLTTILRGVEGFIAQRIDPLVKKFDELTSRLNSLESRPAVKGDPGESVKGADGVDGKDGTNGKDGIDGKDGASVTLEQLAAELMPAMDSSAKQFLESVRTEAIEIVKAIPVPKDGKDGIDGKSLTVADASTWFDQWLDANFSKWALAAERRVYELGERAVEKMPAPVNGKDGLSADDIEIVGRSMLLKRDGNVIKSVTLDFPIWRGVFDDAEAYDAHDMVTYGGSVWIGTEGDRSKRPGFEGAAWKLAVKKGRDGRDAS